jgi:superfamily II DNA or RNA helicase
MEFKREAISHHDDIIVPYDISGYKSIIKNRWDPWKDAPIENASEFCYALRKIVNSDPAREVIVLELIEKHPRAIIFYNFDYELEILKNMAENNNLIFAEWNGHKHQPLPEGDRWIYLVQYNAGAEGWNCIKTDTIIFWSQNYSYKIMVQSSGRIDRLNTPYRDLYYYHLKSKAGIDLAISRALKDKKKFNETGFYSKS